MRVTPLSRWTRTLKIPRHTFRLCQQLVAVVEAPQCKQPWVLRLPRPLPGLGFAEPDASVGRSAWLVQGIGQ
jgi:hypothetical protein